MAIVVEEEKKTNWVTIITVVVVLAIVFVGGYYLFFKNPELIEVVAPDRLQQLNQLSQAKFDPSAVVDSPAFKALRDYTSPLVLPSAGRADPFQP
jgi:flagellar basal body-associated protein FliL